MKAKRIQNCYHVVRDMQRQSTFYREALGLKLQFEDSPRWIQLKAGDSSFALASSIEAGGLVGPIVVFEVDNLDHTRESVLKAGGVMGSLRDMGHHGSILTVRDPEGNAFQLFRRNPTRSEDAEGNS